MTTPQYYVIRAFCPNCTPEDVDLQHVPHLARRGDWMRCPTCGWDGVIGHARIRLELAPSTKLDELTRRAKAILHDFDRPGGSQ